jgi:hypothetical protein
LRQQKQPLRLLEAVPGRTLLLQLLGAAQGQPSLLMWLLGALLLQLLEVVEAALQCTLLHD